MNLFGYGGWVLFAWSLLLLNAALWTWGKRRQLIRWWQERQGMAASCPRAQPPRILLIRPCCGIEPTLERCLLSIQQVQTHAKVEVALGIFDASDSAMKTLEDCQQQLRRSGMATRIVFSLYPGPNRKAAILASCSAGDTSFYDAIFCADVDLSGVDLDRVLAPLMDEAHPPNLGLALPTRRERLKPGAIWLPFIAAASTPAWGHRASRAILNGSWHSFSVLSVLDPQGMVGKCFAIAPQALGEIGGFAALCDVLGEDMALVQKLRHAGRFVIPFSEMATSLASDGTLSAVIRRMSRWLLVIKAQRPWLLASYPAMFFAFPLLVLLSIVGGWGGSRLAIIAGIIATLARMLISHIARSAPIAQDIHAPAAAPIRCAPARGVVHRWVSFASDIFLADVILLLAFFRMLFSKHVQWRGTVLRINSDGRLCAVERVPPSISSQSRE
jgi:ceramide glucosyltransferase